MMIKLHKALLIINILAILLIIVIAFFPSNTGRLILGLPFLLFFPGYTMLAALFPRRGALDSVERVALCFGLSLAIVPLIGLALSNTPWGIKLYPILISLTVFILVASAIAWYRQRRLPEAERPIIALNFSPVPWRGTGLVSRILVATLIAAILGAIGVLGYIMVTPKVGEKFTEFYLRGPEGKATAYPRELVVGEETRVIVGIINREQETVSYRLEVRLRGITNSKIGPLVLGHEEEWEEVVSFTPHDAGDNQKVEFFLYRDGEGEPYLKPLYLWIKVNE